MRSKLLAIGTVLMQVASSQHTAESRTLLNVHNAARVLFHRSFLEWDEGLASSAQQWADRVSATMDMGHDRGSQNLAYSAGPDWPAEKSICHWLRSEGHKSTLLSDEATMVGCGVARSKKGTVVICNYGPEVTTYNPNVKSVCDRLLFCG